MKRIRLLHIEFDTEIEAGEIPAFRSAIIEKVGRENILFHNHLKNDGFLYKYPLIQYKRIGRRPAIICIDFGVDEIHKFFENRNWDIKVNNRWLEMKIAKLNLNQFVMQVWDRPFDYVIRNWIALNQDNYQKYMDLEVITDKVHFLEKTLTGNILSFAKGIEWNVDRQIELTIKDIRPVSQINLKGKWLAGFNVEFASNVFLPNYIGLGKAVSKGLGVVYTLKKSDTNN